MLFLSIYHFKKPTFSIGENLHFEIDIFIREIKLMIDIPEQRDYYEQYNGRLSLKGSVKNVC